MLQEDKNKNNLLDDSSDKIEIQEKGIGVFDKIKNFIKKGIEKNSEKSESDVSFIGSDFAPASTREIKKKFIFLAVILLCNAGIAAFIYAALIVKEKISYGDVKNLEAEKIAAEKEIEGLRDVQDEASQIQNDVALAGYLLDNHIYWDKFFEIIEEHTILGVRYKKFNVDIVSQLKLDAVAENFEMLSRQISIFNKATDYFSNIKLSSISAIQDKKTGKVGGIEFSISMDINRDVFYKKE
ncbi:MAG: hypothetical protein V1891_01750 [bacterium]